MFLGNGLSFGSLVTRLSLLSLTWSLEERIRKVKDREPGNEFDHLFNSG